MKSLFSLIYLTFCEGFVRITMMLQYYLIYRLVFEPYLLFSSYVLEVLWSYTFGKPILNTKG